MKKNKKSPGIISTPSFVKYYWILAAVVVLVFGNTLFNGYNMDDHLVTQNHIYTSKGISAIKQILSSNYYSNNADINFGYRPMVHISFAVEHQLFGEKAGISHLINLLLYIGVVWVLFRITLKWFGTQGTNLAFFVAVLFAVHPIHTETVASIKNRDELLALLFALSSAYAAIRYAESNKVKWLTLVFLYFALGMLSKKSVYPLALVLPAAVYLVHKTNPGKILVLCLTFAIPAAVAGSDFELKRGALLFVLPFAGVLIINVLTRYRSYVALIKKPFIAFNVNLVLLGSSVVLFAYALLTKEIAFGFLAMILASLGYAKNKMWSVSIIMLQFTALAFLFDVKEMGKYAVIIAIGTALNMYKEKKVNYFLISVGVAVTAAYLFQQQNVMNVLMFIEIGLYFFLLNKNALWSLVFIVFSMAFSAILFESAAYHYLFAGFSLIKFFQDKSYIPKLNFNNPLIRVAACVTTLAVIMFYNPIHSPLVEKAVQQQKRFTTEYINKTQTLNNKTFNEGRSLNYIENTLVAQHTREEKLATGFATLAEYARLMLYPAELSFYYGYARLSTVTFSDANAWLGLIFYVLLASVALWQLNKRPLISLGIVWYVLCVLLFSNWFELVAGMVGERLIFAASVGFCITAAGFIAWLKPDFSFIKPKGFDFLLIVLLCVFAVRSFARNQDWKDPLTLMNHDIEYLDQSAQAHNLLALNLMYVASSSNNLSEQTRLDMQKQAIENLKKSVNIYPDFFNTNFDLARIYVGLGDFANAKPLLEKALTIDSENLFALEELAKTCYELKLLNETEQYANAYLAKIPQNENMHEILVYIMLINGKKQSAINYAERALSYYPSNSTLQRMLSDAGKINADTLAPTN